MRGDDLAALLSKLRGGSRVSYSGAPALALRLFVPELYLMKTYYDKKARDFCGGVLPVVAPPACG